MSPRRSFHWRSQVVGVRHRGKLKRRGRADVNALGSGGHGSSSVGPHLSAGRTRVRGLIKSALRADPRCNQMWDMVPWT